MDIATRRLAWGYVAWPPVTPFLARVLLTLFGLSPIGLRSFAVVAEGIVMLLTGLMIRDLGGRRWAQILGAIAVATTPISIIQGGLFQYETLDYLCWVLLAFTIIRLLKTDNPHWWLGIGAAIGLGMMTKYTIAFSVAGVIVGTLATHNRHYLKSRWLWGGALLSLVIWLPNMVWQFQNHWISLYFLASIHARDMQTSSFLIDQILFSFNPVMLFLVISGLYDYWGKDWEYSKSICEKNAQMVKVETRVHFHKGDAALLDFANNTFDGAISNLTFHEVKSVTDKKLALQEALRVVKLGGSFSFVDYFFEEKYYGKESEIEQFLKDLNITQFERKHLQDVIVLPTILKHPKILGKVGIIFGKK